MKKLRLSLEALEIESFTTSPGGNGNGTVEAYCTHYDYSCQMYCTNMCEDRPRTSGDDQDTCLCNAYTLEICTQPPASCTLCDP
ncbi:MAG TPA: hypothetical protein VFQ45_06835 [Longimicrobium sp.]|nr:hypothetical protein [Longimicrobium sp.]